MLFVLSGSLDLNCSIGDDTEGVISRPSLSQPKRRIFQKRLLTVGKVSYIRRERCTSMMPLGCVLVSHFDYLHAFIIFIKHVFTDANLRSKRLLKAINHLAYQLLLKASDVIDDSTHLVLELQAKEDACNYYFVQHDKRLLFSLQDFDDPICIYEHVKGVKSDTHISGCLLALLNKVNLSANNRNRP